MASQDENGASTQPVDGSSDVDSLLGQGDDPDDTFVVEDVIAEAVMKNNSFGVAGERRWLIKWTGYALHDASWEPEECLTPVTLEEWDSTKQEIAAGTKKPFKIREWKRAYISHHRKQIEKQNKANAIRRSQGRNPLPVDDLEFYVGCVASIDSEDESEDDIDWMALDGDGDDSDISTEFSSGSLPAESESDSSSDNEEALNTAHKTAGANMHRRTTDVHQRTTISQPAGPSAKRAQLLKERGSSRGQQPDSSADRRTSAKSLAGPIATGKDGSRIGESLLKSSIRRGHVSATSSNRRAASSSGSAAGRAAGPSGTSAQRKLAAEAYRNVFSIGETSKKKGSTLEKSANNPNLAPKFLSLRHQNILQKRARDGEGTRDPRLGRKINGREVEAAPMESTRDGVRDESPLFLPSEDPMDIQMQDSTKSSAGMPLGVSMEQPRVKCEDEPATTTEQRAPDVSDEAQPDQGVRTSTGYDQPERMDIDDEDDGFLVDDDKMSPARAFPQKSPDLTKPCTLGPARALDITFVGLNGDIRQLFLSVLETTSSLRFTHQCSAEDFCFAHSFLRQTTIASGSTATQSSTDLLRAVNAQLAVDSLGLLCRIRDICVLLFSNSDQVWANNLGIRSQPDCSFLTYAIFGAAPSFEHRLLETFDRKTHFVGGARPPNGVLSLERMLQFSHHRLLPINARGKLQATFFLLFPENVQNECSLVARWLHSCNPSNRILTSFAECNWSSFKEYPSGVVVIHESTLESVRIMPGLGDLLWSPDSTRNHSFWVFGTNDGRLKDVRPISGEDLAENSQAHLLRPLLPDGTAFLMTPSFLLAQPRFAYEFIKWFSKRFVESRPAPKPLCKLVMHMDLPFAKGRPVSNVAGRDVAVHLKKLQHIYDKLLTRNVAGDVEPLANPLVLAPQQIDANDEQSLVNWFAWWATRNLDKFRRFEVLGTAKSDSPHLVQRIRVPRFLAATVRDSGFPIDSVQHEASTSMPHCPPTASTSATSSDQLTLNNALSVIEGELKDMVAFTRTRMPLALLYNRPVGFFSRDMTLRYGDRHSRLATFERWFQFFHPLDKIGKVQNTYFGFFYTIDSAWDPVVHEADLPPLNHPWFAIFRPQNLHRKPWTSTELFIWDATFAEKFSPTETVFEDDLIPAQKALIEQVVELNRQRNPRAALEQVWVSAQGFNSDLDPLRATLRRLGYLLENIKSDLDANSEKLPRCGWSPLQHGARPPGQLPQSAQPRLETPSQFTLGESDTEDDRGERKVVFHPPRGLAELYKKKIQNRLLIAAQEAKDKGTGLEVNFEFVPTVDWYEDLKETKRHSEHIRVVQWSTILQELGIPTRDF